MVTKTMELKDAILSTLVELDTLSQEESEVTAVKKEQEEELFEEKKEPKSSSSSDEEVRYLESIRERLLVLFEGFQSPNNTQIEAKVDLTLNFLEYLLATIDTRLEKIK
jgi:hypothetical protein